LRNLPTENGTLAPSAPEDTATTQTVLTFDDNRRASTLFGQYGQNLALLERKLGVVADSRGNQVTIEGSRDGCERARRVLEGLYEQIRRGHDVAQGDVEAAIRLAIAQGSLFDFDPRPRAPRSRRSTCASVRCARAPPGRTPISARSSATSSCSASARPAPARPGLRSRTPVALFERKAVDRIVLSRPAVEAGERLGFLPGDMREKVDPYLRPIYDALFDLMDPRIVERAMQSGEIEIAPLAFMRGRTLSNAVVILDEAQKHHLDADEDVSDPARRERPHDRDRRSEPDRSAARQTSGLSEAIRLLADVEGIGHVAFTADDVVRHELVARIVLAYDKAAAAKREAGK
jgi:phosphate starvation-inducible PhoH-like protein